MTTMLTASAARSMILRRGGGGRAARIVKKCSSSRYYYYCTSVAALEKANSIGSSRNSIALCRNSNNSKRSISTEIIAQSKSNSTNRFSSSRHHRFLSTKSSGTTTSASTQDRSVICGPYGSYMDEYELSKNDPEQFWKKASELIEWYDKPTKILEYIEYPNFYNWFADGTMNTCYNCLDVHIQNGRGEQIALIYDSPITNVKSKYTYNELLQKVSTFARGLLDIGITKGDRIIIYMPMIPEAIIAMLACTRIGAIHSVVFGGFASKELATRIIDCQPKVIISASAGIEPGPKIIPYKPLLDDAIQIAKDQVGNYDGVQHTIIVQRHNIQECELQQGKDIDYTTFMEKNASNSKDKEILPAVPLPSNHIHYILYTSGTTGLPKGVIRDTAGYAVALKYTMGAFYNSNPGDVYWAASDIGWVVGHSYIVYGPLLNGCTTVLYEGKPIGTPDAGAFWRVIEEYNVKTLFTAPTAFRAMKQSDPNAELVSNYDLSSLDVLFLAGEHSDPDTIHWCEHALKQYQTPVIDHWWQTELGWPGVGNAIGLGSIPIKYGACAAPVPGYNLQIFDDNNKTEEHGEKKNVPVPNNTLGDMVLKLPLPPGTLPSLYNNNERYVKDYLTKFPGYYDTGDAAYMDDDGYVYIMGRADDIINVAGHRLSTGTMEEILMDHVEVADCAVIAVNDTIKGQVPMGLVVTNVNCTMDEETLKTELITMVRKSLGAIANLNNIICVKALPKTRSGKILRKTMSKIANGEEYTITPTIENIHIFDTLIPEIQQQLVNNK